MSSYSIASRPQRHRSSVPGSNCADIVPDGAAGRPGRPPVRPPACRRTAGLRIARQSGECHPVVRHVPDGIEGSSAEPDRFHDLWWRGRADHRIGVMLLHLLAQGRRAGIAGRTDLADGPSAAAASWPAGPAPVNRAWCAESSCPGPPVTYAPAACGDHHQRPLAQQADTRQALAVIQFGRAGSKLPAHTRERAVRTAPGAHSERRCTWPSADRGHLRSSVTMRWRRRTSSASSRRKA